MFYDLNVDYNSSISDADLSKTLAFLSECEALRRFLVSLSYANLHQ